MRLAFGGLLLVVVLGVLGTVFLNASPPKTDQTPRPLGPSQPTQSIGSAPKVGTSTQASANLMMRMFPCVPGASIEYRVEERGAEGWQPQKARIIWTVRKIEPPNLCVIDRYSRAGPRAQLGLLETWTYERLNDRIADAGAMGYTTAFRRPLLKAPLVEKSRWRFNRADFEIVRANFEAQVPAGRFPGSVEVRMKPVDSEPVDAKRFERTWIFAPEVGLIVLQGPTSRLIAQRVMPPKPM